MYLLIGFSEFTCLILNKCQPLLLYATFTSIFFFIVASTPSHSDNIKSISMTAKVKVDEPAIKFIEHLAEESPLIFDIDGGLKAEPESGRSSSAGSEDDTYDIGAEEVVGYMPSDVSLTYDRLTNSFSKYQGTLTWHKGVTITLQHIYELRHESDMSGSSIQPLKPYFEVEKIKLVKVNDKFEPGESIGSTVEFTFGIQAVSTSPQPTTGRYTGSMIFIVEND